MEMSGCGVQFYGSVCGKPCFRGGEYCVDHTCGRNGCLKLSGCGLHECVETNQYYQRCGDVIFDKNTLYCLNHICQGDGCTNGRLKCDVHMCVICGNYKKYPNYNYCSFCLTYEEVFKTLSTHEFYFGAMPKDIINMLIWHLLVSS